ncbi:hypothetical protein SLA2020_189420 [Shorea laevis]
MSGFLPKILCKAGTHSWGILKSKGLVELSKQVRVTIAKVKALIQVVPLFGGLHRKISFGSALKYSWPNMIRSAKEGWHQKPWYKHKGSMNLQPFSMGRVEIIPLILSTASGQTTS